MTMHINSRTRYIFLAIICTIFSVSQAEAQLWGKLKNAVKDKAEEAVKKEVTKKAPQSSEKEKPADKKQKKAQTASVKTTTQKQAENTQKYSPTMVTYQTGTPNGDLDIIGLRLGMSPSQAEAVLKAHNSDYRIMYTRAKLYGDYRLPKDGERAKNEIPGSNYVSTISASDEGFRLRKKGTHITLRFATPPSKNKLLYIKKQTIFQDAGPTVKAYNKAFVKKYGDEFYSTNAARKIRDAKRAKNDPAYIPMPENNHDIKTIRLNSGQKSTNKANATCYGNIGHALGNLSGIGQHIDKYEECGLLLASSHASQSDIAVIFSYKMSLIDFNELNQSHAKMVAFIQDNNKKIKQEKLDAAAKKDVDLF